MTRPTDEELEAVERPIRFRPVVSADGLAAARMDRNGNYVMYADYVAELATLKAELAEAVGLLRYVVSQDDEAVYTLQAVIGLTLAAAKARAFLARHQKETDT